MRGVICGILLALMVCGGEALNAQTATAADIQKIRAKYDELKRELIMQLGSLAWGSDVTGALDGLSVKVQGINDREIPGIGDEIVHEKSIIGKTGSGIATNTLISGVDRDELLHVLSEYGKQLDSLADDLTALSNNCASLRNVVIPSWKGAFQAFEDIADATVAQRKLAVNSGQYLRNISLLGLEHGDPDAELTMGDLCHDGRGVPKDPAQALVWYQKAADQGQATAENKLGNCYLDGDGVTYDGKRAFGWFDKAARQGLSAAENNLGKCYLNGYGVDRDPSQAVTWFRKAAKQGDADAANNLGNCYLTGRGVGKNATKAVKWFRRAAERGYGTSQNNLGVCYAYGEGVVEDPAEAVLWYRKAALQGLPIAQNHLGDCYFNGDGVPKDIEEGVRWYLEAANRGNLSAQMSLASYYNGDGSPDDLAKAYKWWSIALSGTSGGIRNGIQGNISRLNLIMTSVQMETARRLINEWQPQKGL